MLVTAISWCRLTPLVSSGAGALLTHPHHQTLPSMRTRAPQASTSWGDSMSLGRTEVEQHHLSSEMKMWVYLSMDFRAIGDYIVAYSFHLKFKSMLTCICVKRAHQLGVLTRNCKPSGAKVHVRMCEGVKWSVLSVCQSVSLSVSQSVCQSVCPVKNFEISTFTIAVCGDDMAIEK